MQRSEATTNIRIQENESRSQWVEFTSSFASRIDNGGLFVEMSLSLLSLSDQPLRGWLPFGLYFCIFSILVVQMFLPHFHNKLHMPFYFIFKWIIWFFFSFFSFFGTFS